MLTLNRKPPLVLVLDPSPSSVDGASELNAMGSDSAHTKEAAFCDMSAKNLHALCTEGRNTDCFDFDF